MELKLNNGKVALVSASDYKRCLPGPSWFADASYKRDGTLRTYYAARRIPLENGRYRKQYLHRFLLKVTRPKTEVDHRDGNGLNCKRRNLRKATVAQNRQNRINPHKRGYSWCKERRSWESHIRVNGIRLFLGRFVKEKEANKTYKRAMIKYHKTFARKVNP